MGILVISFFQVNSTTVNILVLVSCFTRAGISLDPPWVTLLDRKACVECSVLRDNTKLFQVTALINSTSSPAFDVSDFKLFSNWRSLKGDLDRINHSWWGTCRHIYWPDVFPHSCLCLFSHWVTSVLFLVNVISILLIQIAPWCIYWKYLLLVTYFFYFFKRYPDEQNVMNISYQTTSVFYNSWFLHLIWKTKILITGFKTVNLHLMLRVLKFYSARLSSEFIRIDFCKWCGVEI